MLGFIRKNQKRISAAILIALLACIIYYLLKAMKIINIECTVQYLNPWQLFFECSLFYSKYYLIIFSLSFLIAFYLFKSYNKF